MPFLGGFCAVDLLEEGRVVRRAEQAQADFPSALVAQLHPPAHAPSHAFWAGRPQALPSFLGSDAPSAEEERALRAAGLGSLLRLPLRGQGRPLGVLTLAHANAHAPWTAENRPLAEDFAHRASLSLEAARLHLQVSRADQRKDEFLAMLAHELRNPLAAVVAALEVAKVRSDAAPVLRPLQTAERQARHMARILDDLLDISRITRGKIELRRHAMDLNERAHDAAQTARVRAEARGLTLSVSLWPDELPLHADPDRVEQILTNLLSNATKFTRPGGHLWLSTEREGDDAVVRVRDSGVGIAPETLPHVFELFVQGANSRSEGGLGLGLTLVRELTELHGGTVSAQSAGTGLGTELTVRLPLAPFAEQEKAAPVRAQPDSPTRLHVLLVDDNNDLRESTGELLRLLEHEVVEASDGEEALRKVQTQRFDVAIVDLGLPGLNGYAVAQAIRQLEAPGDPRMAIIALTGYGQPEHRRRTQQAGFDEHLTKPLDFDRLREVLARWVPAAAASPDDDSTLPWSNG